MTALVFEWLKLFAWAAVFAALCFHKRAIPVNLFWLLLSGAVLMLYAVVASLVSHHVVGTHVRDMGNLVVAGSYIYLIDRYRNEYKWVRDYRKRNKLSL